MLTALIVEDEMNASALLESMLHEIAPDIRIVGTCGDLPAAVKCIRRHQPSVVFLDVDLPVYSGLQLFDFFDTDEINFQVIFTTAFAQHAVRAFELSAVDYLLKPLQEDKLRLAMHKLYKLQHMRQAPLIEALKENLQTNGHGKIVLPVSSGYEVISPAEILFLKAEGSYCQIFIKNKTSITVSKNLKYFEELLSPAGCFFRIHRSFLVNINSVTRILREDGAFAILEENSQLPVAADKVDQVVKLITNAALLVK